MTGSTEQLQARGVHLWAEDIVSLESFDDCEERLLISMSRDERNRRHIPLDTGVEFFVRSKFDKEHDMVKGDIYIGHRTNAVKRSFWVASYKCYKLPVKEPTFVLPGFISAQWKKTNLAELRPKVQDRRRTRDAKLLEDARTLGAPLKQLVASSSGITPRGHDLRSSQEYRHPDQSAAFPRRMSKRAATDPSCPSQQATMSNIPRKANTFSTSTLKDSLTKHTGTAKEWLKRSFSKKS